METPTSTTITGIVVDVLGQPIADAWVGLCHDRDYGDEDEHDEAVFESRTGADGRFVFAVEMADADDMPMCVVAKAPQRARGSEHLRRYGRMTTFARVVLPEANALRGRVTDQAGAALAGVEVVVRHAGRVHDAETRRTDADGRFAFDAVPVGLVFVSAWRSDRQLAFVEHEVHADSTLDLQLVPAHQRVVRFRIVGASKQQLATAWCYMYDFEGRLPASCLRGVPDEDGIWEVRGLPNEWQYRSLHVSIPGMHCVPLFEECPAHEMSGCYEFVFTMRAHVARQVHGRLLTERDEPVAGARLEVRSIREPGQQVVTDADGRFVITTVVPDGETLQMTLASADLVIDGPGDPQWRSPIHRRRFVVSMPHAEELALRAVPAAALRGRCVMADGSPCAGAFVQMVIGWQHDHGEHQGQLEVAESDADGRFTFANHNARLGGPVQVSAARDLWEVRTEPVLLQEGAVVELPRLVAPPTASVAGVLCEADGRVLSGEVVDVVGAGEPDPDFHLQRACTTRDGRFRITGLTAGAWRLQSATGNAPPRWSSEPFEVEAGEALQRDFVAVRVPLG